MLIRISKLFTTFDNIFVSHADCDIFNILESGELNDVIIKQFRTYCENCADVVCEKSHIKTLIKLFEEIDCVPYFINEFLSILQYLMQFEGNHEILMLNDVSILHLSYEDKKLHIVQEYALTTYDEDKKLITNEYLDASCKLIDHYLEKYQYMLSCAVSKCDSYLCINNACIYVNNVINVPMICRYKLLEFDISIECVKYSSNPLFAVNGVGFEKYLLPIASKNDIVDEIVIPYKSNSRIKNELNIYKNGEYFTTITIRKSDKLVITIDDVLRINESYLKL